MSMEAHQRHTLTEGAKRGRTIISSPELSFPAPNRRKNLIFSDNWKKEPPNSWAPKVAQTTPRVVLTRAFFSQGALVAWHPPPPLMWDLPWLQSSAWLDKHVSNSPHASGSLVCGRVPDALDPF